MSHKRTEWNWSVTVREMGQAFRRASGRIRASSEVDTTSFSKPKTKRVVDRPPPPPKLDISKTAAQEQDKLNAGELV